MFYRIYEGCRLIGVAGAESEERACFEAWRRGASALATASIPPSWRTEELRAMRQQDRQSDGSPWFLYREDLVAETCPMPTAIQHQVRAPERPTVAVSENGDALFTWKCGLSLVVTVDGVAWWYLGDRRLTEQPSGEA